MRSVNRSIDSPASEIQQALEMVPLAVYCQRFSNLWKKTGAARDNTAMNSWKVHLV